MSGRFVRLSLMALLLAACATQPATRQTAAPARVENNTTNTNPNSEPKLLEFVDLYSGASIEGPILSDLAQALNNHKVIMQGYMAPPLKPDADFFVLTQTPMAYCPFCSSSSDWPFNIVFIRMADGQAVPALSFKQGVRVVGTLSVGTATDAATGFVSKVRVLADTVDVSR